MTATLDRPLPRLDHHLVEPDPSVPEALAPWVLAHDLMDCPCQPGEPCTVALWDEGAISTGEAIERLGVEA